MGKQKYLMANLCYGPLYVPLFLENQLKSLKDPTNLPALSEKYDLEYMIITDQQSQETLTRHPNFMALSQLAEITLIKMDWPPDADQFGSRYSILVQLFHEALNRALSKGQWLSVWVADLVFAKNALPRMLSHLERGHDGVMMVPIRSAADSVNQHLQKMTGAPSDLELFELAYQNLHHLWVASDWHAGMFSKFPYSMLWNSRSGLLAHNFGITPIVFKPTEAMRAVRGVIDADVPSFCKNPYWCTDWTDAPVAGVEPLSNGHYPPFRNHSATPEFVAEWSRHGTQPVQSEYLTHPLYYPSKKIFNNEALASEAASEIEKIRQLLGASSAT
jgi:hypothetical protein